MMATVALTLLQNTRPAPAAAAQRRAASLPLPGRAALFNRDARAGLFAAAIALHALAALGFLVALPLYDWPDEPAHLTYIRRLAAGGGFDVMRPGAWRADELEALKRVHFRDHSEAARAVIASLAYEAHQPPLYYLLGAAIYRLTASPTAVKLLNLVLSCVSTALAWMVARRLYPDDGRVAVAAVFLLALAPTRCFMAVSISNDLLAEVLFGCFILAALRGSPPAVVGALIGVGLLSKANMLLALPLYAAWLALDARRRDRRDALRRLAVALGIAVAVASPWLVRNVALYGWSDPLAIQAGALARSDGLAQLTWSGPSGVRAFLFILFASWWGVFGWMGMFPDRVLLRLYALLCAVPLAGGAWAVLRGRVRATAPRAARLLWLALAPALVTVSLLLYSLQDFQPQGRYLMLASACIGVLWAAGARAACGRWLTVWTMATALALAWANIHSIAHVIPWYLTR